MGKYIQAARSRVGAAARSIASMVGVHAASGDRRAAIGFDPDREPPAASPPAAPVGFFPASPEQMARHKRPFQKQHPSAFRNFLRVKYELYTGKVEVRSRPYVLIVDPCDACGLRCTTCPTGIENAGRRSRAAVPVQFRTRRLTMPAPLFESLLDELGDEVFLILFFNFGEPLHNRQLPAFIRQAKARHIETEIHTHLSLSLSDDMVQDLVDSGLDHLQASIDGFTQEAYQIHRVGGDIARVKHNLERLVAARDRLGADTCITYSFLVFAHNEHEIPLAKAYCRKLGINFNARDAFIDDPTWLPAHRVGEAPWTVPAEVRHLATQRVGWSPPVPLAAPAHWPGGCSWHYGYSVIQPGGQLAPCDAVSKEAFDMGTLVPDQGGFGAVWNNDAYRRARAHFAAAGGPGHDAAGPLCLRCPWPPFLRHLFSLNDGKVVFNYHQTLRGRDPVLHEGFDRLCRVRFGLSLEEFVARGEVHPMQELLVGHESPGETADFVRFFEDHLDGDARPVG